MAIDDWASSMQLVAGRRFSVCFALLQPGAAHPVVGLHQRPGGAQLAPLLQSKGGSPSCPRPMAPACCMGAVSPIPALAAPPALPALGYASLLTGCDRPWRSWGSPCRFGKRPVSLAASSCFATALRPSGGCRQG